MSDTERDALGLNETERGILIGFIVTWALLAVILWRVW
jgi:hypothetical protein